MARVRSVLLCEISAAARITALLFILLAAHAASAAIYPVRARLTLAPPASQHCLVFAGETDCRIVRTVKEAFAATVSRMFNPGGDAPDLQLVLAVKSVEASRVSGTQVDLVVRVKVLAPGGELIDELETSSTVDILEMQSEAIARGQQVAAHESAVNFERAYANSTKIGEYLVGKKVAPAAAVAVAKRSENLVSIILGIDIVTGGGDSGVAPAPSLRFAFAARWFFVQATFSHYASPFQGVVASGFLNSPTDANLNTNDLGLEAGAVLHFTPTLELRAGPGIHYLFGDGEIEGSDGSGSASFAKAVPTLFASFSTSFIAFRHGPRVVLGVEARAYLFSSVDLPELLRTVPTANISFGGFVGLEFPWDSKARSAP
jgi:hypothetical protein